MGLNLSRAFLDKLMRRAPLAWRPLMESSIAPQLSYLKVDLTPGLEEHRGAFVRRFGGDPDSVRLFFAPGRMNLMGAHLDYNGGPVMPMAIDRGTFVAARMRADERLTLASMSEAGEGQFSMRALAERGVTRSGQWWDYATGVLGCLPLSSASRGMDLLFGGDLPVGAGLSSSASMTLATAVALNGLLDLHLDVQAAVEAALCAERDFVGVQCGIMDPYAVGHARQGHLLLLDCTTRAFEHVRLDAERYGVCVVDTGVRRELASGEFNLRVEQCAAAYAELSAFCDAPNLAGVPLDVFEAHQDQLEPTVARRARHIIEETARTFDARYALKAGDVERFGAAMFAAHDSLRKWFEVSIPELDTLAELAKELPGVLGARLTGAGFGGCVAVVFKVGAEADLERHMRAGFAARYGREPQVAFYRGSPGLGEGIG